MCVIYYARTVDKRPTLSELRAGAERNSDGAGYAYYGPGMIPRWKRGQNLSPEEIFDDLRGIKGPVLIHFRTASVGPKCEELTHPFEMKWEQSEEKEGEAPEGLLMQNGTWSGWKSALIDAVRIGAGRLKLQAGKAWNDGKTMAALAGVYGPGILENIDIGASRLGIMLPPSAQFPQGTVYPLGSGWERGSGGWLQSSATGSCRVTYDSRTSRFHASSDKKEEKKDERSEIQKAVDQKLEEKEKESTALAKFHTLPPAPTAHVDPTKQVHVITNLPNSGRKFHARVRKLGVQVVDNPSSFSEDELLECLITLENEKIPLAGLLN